MCKLSKLFNDYQIEKPNIDVYKDCIKNIVDNSIRYYSGYTTPPLQEKFDKIINKIENVKQRTGKNFILKNFMIEMNEKLKEKIQSIRDQNFAYDKANWQRKKKYIEYMRERFPNKTFYY
jgi:hypothetical protein